MRLEWSKLEFEKEMNSGRFPPCIRYKIIFSSPEEMRVKPTLVIVHLRGANVPLTFSCRIKEQASECVCVQQ